MRGSWVTREGQQGRVSDETQLIWKGTVGALQTQVLGGRPHQLLEHHAPVRRAPALHLPAPSLPASPAAVGRAPECRRCRPQ